MPGAKRTHGDFDNDGENGCNESSGPSLNHAGISGSHGRYTATIKVLPKTQRMTLRGPKFQKTGWVTSETSIEEKLKCSSCASEVKLSVKLSIKGGVGGNYIWRKTKDPPECTLKVSHPVFVSKIEGKLYDGASNEGLMLMPKIPLTYCNGGLPNIFNYCGPMDYWMIDDDNYAKMSYDMAAITLSVEGVLCSEFCIPSKEGKKGIKKRRITMAKAEASKHGYMCFFRGDPFTADENTDVVVTAAQGEKFYTHRVILGKSSEVIRQIIKDHHGAFDLNKYPRTAVLAFLTVAYDHAAFLDDPNLSDGDFCDVLRLVFEYELVHEVKSCCLASLEKRLRRGKGQFSAHDLLKFLTVTAELGLFLHQAMAKWVAKGAVNSEVLETSAWTTFEMGHPRLAAELKNSIGPHPHQEHQRHQAYQEPGTSRGLEREDHVNVERPQQPQGTIDLSVGDSDDSD